MPRLPFIPRRAVKLATQPSLVLGLAMIAMLWAAVAYKFKDQAERDHRDAVQNLNNLALLFEANVLHSIGEIDKALFYLRREVEHAPNESELQRIVANPNLVTRATVQFAIVDAAGRVKASSMPEHTKSVDLSDREYYHFHRSTAADELYAGKPVFGRISNTWAVPLTRRIGKAGETFLGLVLASLNPEHFRQLYGSINLGPSGWVTLFGTDGIVRASVAPARHGRLPVGADLNGSRLLQEVHSRESGSFVEAAPDDNRIVSYRRIRGLPLAVGVGVAEAQVYAAAHRDAIKHGILAALISLVILAVGTKGARDQLRLRLAKAKVLYTQRHALQKSEQLGLTLDNMTQGIILVTRDGRMPVINRRALELLDLPEAFLRDKPTFPEFVKYLWDRGEFASVAMPEGMSALDYFTRRDAHGRFATYERSRPNGMVLEVRTSTLPGGGFVRTFSDITPNRQAQEAVVRLTSEDGLTGLANRRHFGEEVDRMVQRLRASKAAEADDQGFALLCLDIDWFKAVNDTAGHWIGDALLQGVAQRLKSTVRAGNLVARLGGDEFGVLIPNTCSTEQPEALAVRLSDILSQPYDIGGQHIRISVSIGIALAPHDGTDPELLLRASDMALYAAKAAGRATYRFFHKSMAEQLRQRRQLELDLRNAIDNDELALHYQPVFETATKKITGFEALMRWDHPLRGMVPPSEFIPIAEETGLIVSLGSWALRKACDQATKWPERLTVAVNVSPMQFRTGNLVATVSTILHETGLAPSRLYLEITETILMHNSESTIQVLNQLRELGVRISMDDFGTGYSSLSYLRTFPLDKIKIDRAFVKDLGVASASDVIIRSIIDIATTLNMTTTAEGVETREQFERLAALGCTEAQGYYLGKAVPSAQLAEVIAKWGDRLAA